MKLTSCFAGALALLVLVSGSALANKLTGVDLSGIQLKPGERIVAIDGVPVEQLSASQRRSIQQATSKATATKSTPTKVTVAKPVIDDSTPATTKAKSTESPTLQPVATNIAGNLVRSNKSFSHSDGVTALDKANTERRKQGYGALIADPELQALALRKATIAAQRSFKNHIGGSLGSAKCEGVGWTNGRFLTCCLDEPGTYGGAAMVQGRDGWYCCLLVR